MSEELFTCEVEILRHSDRAVLVKYKDEESWLPKSQMVDATELPESGPAEVSIASWLAKKKDWI